MIPYISDPVRFYVKIKIARSSELPFKVEWTFVKFKPFISLKDYIKIYNIIKIYIIILLDNFFPVN